MIGKSIPNQSFIIYDEGLEMYDLRFLDIDGTTFQASSAVTEFVNGLLTISSDSSVASVDSPNYFGDELSDFTTIGGNTGSGLLSRLGNRIRVGNFAQLVRNEILELAKLYADKLLILDIKTQVEYASGIIKIYVKIRDLSTDADLNFVI